MVLHENPERTKKAIQRLLQWYKKRDGMFSGEGNPEDLLPNGVQSGSYEHIMFITMCSTIDYNRNADALWEAGRKTWADESTRWVFFPSKVEQKTHEDLITDLDTHGLSRKPNQDAKYWHIVSLSFLELFDGDPRNMFKKFDFDASEIRKYMRKKGTKVFPYLGGATGLGKINAMCIRILRDEAGINFKNCRLIPMPVDIHVMRATFAIGCLVGEHNGPSEKLKKMIVDAWKKVCECPIDLDEALFNLSRKGCSNVKNGKCPKSNECELYPGFCVTANPRCKLEVNNDEVHIDTAYPSDKI